MHAAPVVELDTAEEEASVLMGGLDCLRMLGNFAPNISSVG